MNHPFFNLKEITNQNKWISIQDSIADVTGLAIITVDYKGVPVTKHSRCQKFCKIMREDMETAKYCQKCDSRGGLEAVRLNKSYIYLCHANILDFAIPIIVEGKYVGAIMAGQVLLTESETKYKLEKIAHDPLLEDRFKGNIKLWEYYKMLPVYTMDQIERMMRMIENISKYIVGDAVIKNGLFEINRRLLNLGDRDLPHSDSPLADIKNQVVLIERTDIIDHTREAACSPLICKAIRYIQENVERVVTLSEVARYCYVSKSYFSRLFKKETDENFSDYVTKYKMSIALEQLESTEKSVIEISSDLGFNDCSYFIKCFKKIKGVTPAVYRKLTKHNTDLSTAEIPSTLD